MAYLIMGFTLYNAETGGRLDYDFGNSLGRVNVGRRDIARTLDLKDSDSKDDLVDRLLHVSRKHLGVIRRVGDYELLDYSQGRVCINGTAVKGGATLLKSGDLIRLGPENADTALHFYFLINGETDKFIRELSEKREEGPVVHADNFTTTCIYTVPPNDNYETKDLNDGNGDK